MSLEPKSRISVLIGACAVLVLLAPFAGGGLGGPRGEFILWQLRVPRMLVALLVGSTLSLVGATYQTILANPLAAPSTVGTTAGATLGALVAIVAGTSVTAMDLPLTALAAFAGALLVTLLLTGIAWNGRAGANDVLLLGVAISLAAGAIATGIQFTADTLGLAAAVRWGLGHLPQVGYRGVLVLLPFVVLVHVILLEQIRGLESLAAGEERAHSQGVDLTRIRGICLGGGALGVGACVAWCGPIAFVGLIVPHLVRRAVGVQRRVLLPMSSVVGGGFLVLCDAVSRLLWPGRELPVGVLTAAIGAPLLVWLVARRGNRAGF